MTILSPHTLSHDIEVQLENVERMDTFADKYVHKWTIPETTIAEVIAGSYEIEHSGKRLFIEPGEMYLIQANTPVSITHHFGSDGRMEAQWVRFTALLYKTDDIINLFDMPLKISGEQTQPIRKIISELLEISHHGQVNADGQVQRCLADAFRIPMLLNDLVRIIISMSSPKPNAFTFLDHADRMGPVLMSIHYHLAEPIQVEELADIACLSPSHFHAEFKMALGQSPINYIRRIRIREACRLLLHSDRKIHEIAELTGFGNAYYFCRAFKTLQGVPPRDYRKTNR